MKYKKLYIFVALMLGIINLAFALTGTTHYVIILNAFSSGWVFFSAFATLTLD